MRRDETRNREHVKQTLEVAAHMLPLYEVHAYAMKDPLINPEAIATIRDNIVVARTNFAVNEHFRSRAIYDGCRAAKMIIEDLVEQGE